MNSPKIDQRARVRTVCVITGALVLMLGAAPGGAQPVTVQRGAGLFDQGVIPARIEVDMTRLKAPRRWQPGDPIKEVPQRKGIPKDFVLPEIAPQPEGGDPLRVVSRHAAARAGGRAFDTPLINRDGVGFTGVNPPDTVGDVGNDHFVQMVNGGGAVGGTQVLILDKNDGTEVARFALAQLAEGSQTGCTLGAGDPLVLFDSTVVNGPGELPGRWFLMEFTDASFCVYVSQTSDPMAGTWYLYEFLSDSGDLPDYPKIGVWSDAYYIGANEDGNTSVSVGRTVYALDRENMLAGLPTRPTQVFEAPPMAGFGFQLLVPADWDGVTPPPASSPGLFLRHRDDEVHNAGSADPTRDFVEFWEFDVDWSAPANSTFSGPFSVGVAEFESELCGLTSFACVPQPGSGTRLDPLREPMMWRVQYRNFGSHQMLLGSWVSDVAGGAADLHGVRWTEFRNTGGGWFTQQQGTVAPDDVHRWMSSIAMDGDGNIALGYNVSRPAPGPVPPGLRYTGRLAGDPAGSMPIPEVTLAAGSAANGSNRYGDYAAMTVDPLDECTFWFTGEYNPASFWSTRIGSFRFDSCGEPAFRLRSENAAGAVCTASGQAQVMPFDVEALALGGFAGSVSLGFSPPPPVGVTPSLSPNPVPAGQFSAGTLSVDPGVAPGRYDLTLLGSAGSPVADSTMALQLDVVDSAPSAVAQMAPADGAGFVALRPVFEWTASGGADRYRLEVARDPGFTDRVIDQTVSGTMFQPQTELESQTAYYWRVTPLNLCGAGTTSSVRSFTTLSLPGDCAADQQQLVHLFDDFETGATGWAHSAAVGPDLWALQSDTANSPVTAWQTSGGAGSTSDQRLDSPTVTLPAGVATPTLQFFMRRDIEAQSTSACFDGAVLERSVDGGASWQVMPASAVQLNPYTGPVSAEFGNPLASLDAWCGQQPNWTRTIVDLRGLEGEQLRFRFRFGADSSVASPGWWIDDVTVQSCQTDRIFADGFEEPPL